MYIGKVWFIVTLTVYLLFKGLEFLDIEKDAPMSIQVVYCSTILFIGFCLLIIT